MTDARKNTPHLEAIEEFLKALGDDGPVTQDTVLTWYRFNVYLVNLAETDGWVYLGHSFRIKQPMSLLVVRAAIDGIQHVVFSSGRTSTDCMRAFLRKMSEGWLEWMVDKFA